MKRHVRILHRPTGTVIAEGPIGWVIKPFEGNYYVSRRGLRTNGFRPNWIPGFCIYKFLYVWLDFEPVAGRRTRFLGWKYWLPNPLLPFIWFRVAVPGAHPEILVESIDPAA